MVSVIAIWALLASGTGVAIAATSDQDATAPQMLVGASSGNWTWFDQAVGPAQIYRVFDTGGFHYATWQDTLAYRQHPDATAFDYSFDVLPQRLTDPNDPINDKIRAFLATTPKNLIITTYHEPDDEFGLFTPAEYRAGIVALADMVRAQNALDGGTRKTSVILMAITFTGYWSTSASDWWPTDERDGGHADLIEGDMYEWPHATNTPGVPPGYTDGVKWRTASRLLSPLRDFARAHNTPWAIAELGILEDVHSPTRRADELADAVRFARDNGALHICYFDNRGSRADWRLRWSSPPGTSSANSAAATMWKSLMDSGNNPAPTEREWVLNPGMDGGSRAGWTVPFSSATSVSTTQQAGNWVLTINNKRAEEGDVGACNGSPYWVTSTEVGTTYRATGQALPSRPGISVRLFLREVAPNGSQVRFVKSQTVALNDITSLSDLPPVTLTARQSGDSLRMCLVADSLSPDETLYSDNFSLTSPK